VKNRIENTKPNKDGTLRVTLCLV